MNDLKLLQTIPTPTAKEEVSSAGYSPETPALLQIRATRPYQFYSLNSKPVPTILQLHGFHQFQDCRYMGLVPGVLYCYEDLYLLNALHT